MLKECSVWPRSRKRGGGSASYLEKSCCSGSDPFTDIDLADVRYETSTMFEGPPNLRRLALTFFAMGTAGAIGLLGWQHISQRDVAYDASLHSHEQNLTSLGATDACEMLPMEQFGNPYDSAGNRVNPVMTIYLKTGDGRKPRTGDIIEILYPEDVEGRVRFTQATNDGFGGSGPLEWIGESRDAELALAVWDSTFSGSLQYLKGGTALWGDCKKSYELKVQE